MSDKTKRASTAWLAISFAIAISVLLITKPEPTSAATGDPVLLNDSDFEADVGQGTEATFFDDLYSAVKGGC